MVGFSILRDLAGIGSAPLVIRYGENDLYDFFDKYLEKTMKDLNKMNVFYETLKHYGDKK